MALAVQGSFDDLGTPLSQVTFVVLDVETTGGSPASGSLTEVAAARYRGGELLGTYQTFVRPDERIPPYITALTGISDAMVADAPRIGEMLPSFLEFLGGGVVVGHNVRFDLSFLNHALAVHRSGPAGQRHRRHPGTGPPSGARHGAQLQARHPGRRPAPPPPAVPPGPHRRAGHRRPAPRPAGAGRHLRHRRSGGAARPAPAGRPSPGGQAEAHHPAPPPTRRLLVRRRRRKRPLRGQGHRPAHPGPLLLLRATPATRSAGCSARWTPSTTGSAPDR